MNSNARPTLSLLASLALATLGTLAALRPAPAQAADTVVLKIATVVPKNSVWMTDLQDMADEWKTISNGTVTVRFYPGGVAGDDVDVVRKIKLGTLDGSLFAVSGLHTMDKSVSAFTIPMMFDSYDEFYTVLDGLRPELDKKYDAQGLVVLHWADAGWVHFLTKEPVKTPDDLRKLKIFTWQDDASGATDLWKTAGFTAVPLPSTEISTALQTGLISAVPTSVLPAQLMQWNQHAKYMTDLKWAVLIGATVVSKKSWEKIPADLRPKLLEAADRAGKKMRTDTQAVDAQAVKAMTDHGLTVIQPDVEAWHKTVEPQWANLRGNLVPTDMFDKVKAARDAMRAKGATVPVKGGGGASGGSK